mgnify:CR=1 FL=1
MPVEQARKFVQQQHAFLQAVLDGTPEPIMAIGRDYCVLMANRAARDLAPQMSGASHCYEVSHHRSTPCDDIDHPCPLRQVLDLAGGATTPDPVILDGGAMMGDVAGSLDSPVTKRTKMLLVLPKYTVRPT